MDVDTILLLRYAESRDAEAFGELVHRHSSLVYATALRVVGNVHDAEDVAQTCFLELARKAGAIRKSLPGWLHSLAVSRAIDAIRARSTRRAYERAHPAKGDASEPAWEDISALVDQAVAELPDELRSPIILRFLEGRTQMEAAAELNVSQSTVSRHIGQGIERLRGSLRKMGVVTPAAVLAALLSDNAVVAAPATLTASLGKIALVGVGSQGVTAGASATASASASASGATSAAGGMTLGGKMGIGLLVAAASVAAVALQVGSRTTSEGASRTAPVAAPPPSLRTDPSPVQPFRLTDQFEGMETTDWRPGGWGNPVTFETVEMGGRGRVLKVNCEQGNKSTVVCGHGGYWNTVERPFLVFDFRCEFDHEVPVAMGVDAASYYEGSVRRPASRDTFTRAVYDLSQHNFKMDRYDWIQGLPIERPDLARKLLILCFPQKEQSQAGVLLLDNVRLAKGVLDVVERASVPFAAVPTPNVLPGDFDNDGTLDRLVLHPRLSLERGDRDGSDLPLPEMRGPGSDVQSATWADIDRDGFLDLVVLQSKTGPLSILLGDGKGSFLDATDDWVFPAEPLISRIESIAAFDEDADGDPDLYLGLEDGTWLVAMNGTPRAPYGTASLSISLEGPVDREQIVTLRDSQDTPLGARLLRPHIDGMPAASSQAIYFVPPGDYVVSVGSMGRKTRSTTVHVERPGQRVVITPHETFALWPKRPVTVGGTMAPGEWDSAPSISHTLEYVDVKTNQSETHPMTLWYRADPYALYLCVKIEGEDAGGTQKMDLLTVYFDNDGDGVLEPNEDVKAIRAHLYNDYYRLPVSHGLRSECDPLFDGSGAVFHSTGSDRGDYVYELMVPWSSKDPNDISVVGDTTLGIKIVFTESLKKGSSWQYAPRSFDGYPDGDSQNGETYARLTVEGLTRSPGVRPGPVRVRIVSPTEH